MTVESFDFDKFKTCLLPLTSIAEQSAIVERVDKLIYLSTPSLLLLIKKNSKNVDHILLNKRLQRTLQGKSFVFQLLDFVLVELENFEVTHNAPTFS
jgi:hypothetical protein